jgi:hypothetical protein
METQITSNWIDRYNDDELTESERKLFQEKMKSNSLLRKEQQLDQKLNAFLADKELLDFMEQIRDLPTKSRSALKRLKKILFAASFLSLSFAVMIFVINYYGSSAFLWHRTETRRPDANFRQPLGSGQNTTSLQPESPEGEKVYPSTCQNLSGETDKYQCLPEFELLVGSIYRGTMLKMVLPDSDSSIGQHGMILFQWEIPEFDEQVSFTIEFVNNKGKKVFESPVLTDTNCYPLYADSLGTGLFYWKILAHEDIIKMGKIAVY